MEKILIGKKDRSPYDSELRASESRLNNVFDKLSDYLPAPTFDDLKDVLKGGKSAKSRFDKDVEETLAAIKVPALRTEQAARLNQMSKELNTIIQDAAKFKGSQIAFIPDSLLELRNGSVRFASEASALIEEHCNIYIETDDQMQTYKLSRSLCDVLNKMQVVLNPYQVHENMITAGAVSFVDGKWMPVDGFVSAMPARANLIKEHEDYIQDQHDRTMEERRKEEERTKNFITNPGQIQYS